MGNFFTNLATTLRKAFVLQNFVWEKALPLRGVSSQKIMMEHQDQRMYFAGHPGYAFASHTLLGRYTAAEFYCLNPLHIIIITGL